jgi:hypothetical protein
MSGEYFENEGVIYHARRFPGMASPYVDYKIIDGQWQQCSGRERVDAYSWGNPMTEEEAKKFQGEGWPKSPCPAPTPSKGAPAKS